MDPLENSRPNERAARGNAESVPSVDDLVPPVPIDNFRDGRPIINTPVAYWVQRFIPEDFSRYSQAPKEKGHQSGPAVGTEVSGSLKVTTELKNLIERISSTLGLLNPLICYHSLPVETGSDPTMSARVVLIPAWGMLTEDLLALTTSDATLFLMRDSIDIIPHRNDQTLGATPNQAPEYTHEKAGRILHHVASSLSEILTFGSMLKEPITLHGFFQSLNDLKDKYVKYAHKVMGEAWVKVLSDYKITDCRLILLKDGSAAIFSEKKFGMMSATIPAWSDSAEPVSIRDESRFVQVTFKITKEGKPGGTSIQVARSSFFEAVVPENADDEKFHQAQYVTDNQIRMLDVRSDIGIYHRNRYRTDVANNKTFRWFNYLLRYGLYTFDGYRVIPSEKSF